MALAQRCSGLVRLDRREPREQARYAVLLLQAGAPIAMVAQQADYFDHPHLSRSLRRFTGAHPGPAA